MYLFEQFYYLDKNVIRSGTKMTTQIYKCNCEASNLICNSKCNAIINWTLGWVIVEYVRNINYKTNKIKVFQHNIIQLLILSVTYIPI